MDRATWIGGGAILLWASLALLTTSTAGIPPFELLALSFAVAFLASAVVLARGGLVSLRRLRQPWAAWALGFGGIFCYHALYFVALKSAPPAEASLVAYLWPLLIVLLSAALPGERPGERLGARQLAGAVMGLVGTALVLRLGRHEAGPAPVLGYAAAAGCALVWSGYSVLNRRFASVPSEVIGGVCGLVALAGLACHLAFETAVWPDHAQSVAIVLLGLGPVGAAFFAWDHATKHGRLATLGTLSYLAPLLSTLLLVAAGRTPARLVILLAATLVIAGAAIATRDGDRANSARVRAPPSP